MKPRISIFGTLHDYQRDIYRPKYFETLSHLIAYHAVELVAEEASGPPTTYAEQLIKNASEADSNFKVKWKNVDLTGDERKKAPDINRANIGTIIDFDLHTLREWVWVVRTAKEMKKSNLLICGMAHMFSVADKFQWAGFDLAEVHHYMDGNDYVWNRDAGQ